MRLGTSWAAKRTLVGLLCLSLFGCHQSSQSVRTDPRAGVDATGYVSSSGSEYPSPPPESSTGAGQLAPSYAPQVLADKRVEQDASLRRQAERPGLGTEYGETRYSPVRDVPFERATDSPLFIGSVHYNDAQGARAQQDRLVRRYYPGEPLWRMYQGNRPTPWVGVTVSVVDEYGQPLPSYHLANHILVVGTAGQRYAIQVDNRTPHRFELVASVDGQDVVDGQSANLSKRGYIVDSYRQVRIDGFRKSMSEVAAFRFGSVRNSYAARTSEFGDRNVGVIGIALFGERGIPMSAYSPDLDDEARRREAADPFPGRFAPPPPQPLTPRPYY
ncbi:MAG: hypothetical protein JNM40_03855 [Myxococcales bacterium]|nr:hypothetical protein [Myxococcales bacterium]